MEFDLFVNDSFRILKLLYDNQTTVLDKKVIPLTQVEISNELGMSKAKINMLIGELQKNGYVAIQSRGKYILLDKAKCIVEDIDNIEAKLEKM